MPRLMTVYDVLISCPSDVEEYVSNVKQAIQKFNCTYGDSKNIRLFPKYWKEVAYAQSGGRPQELLNHQIVENSDIAIAFFGTKFGEPTERFGSGTEEEIEIMMSAGKQVFVYFLEKAISPSMINIREIKKIEDFKKKYKNKGIYYAVENERELEIQIKDGLEHYFNTISL